jgi:hypothetical protein
MRNPSPSERFIIGTLSALLTMDACGQSLVNGTNYPDLFAPSGSVTVDPSDGGLVGITLGGSATGPVGTYWDANAQGGASVSLLGIGLAETGAQVELTGSELRFDISNNADSLLGRLGTGAGVALNWSATATFDATGNELILAPNTIYVVTFDVDGSNGLLNSTLGLLPAFGLEFLDGSGTPIGVEGGGTLVNIIGLSLEPVLGPAVGTGRATVNFTTGSTVAGGPAGLRFTGEAVIPATAFGIGTNFATITNIGVTQIPEPSLLAFVPLLGGALLIQRKR